MESSKYEPVIGLEVHIQLLTNSKAYSSDSTEYGAMPNTNVSVVSLGHPGTLPKVNKKNIEYAARLGLACGSTIRRENEYARKNYFYADLPKGYQITQDTTPICTGGSIKITLKDGSEKEIGITRIHMEEDSGKSIHDQDPFNTLIDLNRAGVALLEMVSEPELCSPEEAHAYLSEVRKLVRYLEICDGNMEEGSLRCDANVSVRLKGEEAFGTKVEVKNMNSISNVQRALEYEIERQIDELENGHEIFQETRSYDASTGKTFLMRTKEMADDYRYFPEPDLPIVIVTEEFLESVKKEMPALPNELIEKYTKEIGLSMYDARVLTDSKAVALYYDKLISHTSFHKTAANWVMGSVKSYLNENGIGMKDFPLSEQRLAALIDLIESGRVSHTIAVQKLFAEMIKDLKKDPLQIAEENNWIQESDTDSILVYIEQALEKYPDKVQAYKKGNKNLLGLFMGEVMKLSKGKADPKLASQLVREHLDKK